MCSGISREKARLKFMCIMTGRRFSPGTPVSSTNKTNRHDIIEILLKVTLNTITLTLTPRPVGCISLAYPTVTAIPSL